MHDYENTKVTPDGVLFVCPECTEETPKPLIDIADAAYNAMCPVCRSVIVKGMSKSEVRELGYVSGVDVKKEIHDRINEIREERMKGDHDDTGEPTRSEAQGIECPQCGHKLI